MSEVYYNFSVGMIPVGNAVSEEPDEDGQHRLVVGSVGSSAAEVDQERLRRHVEDCGETPFYCIEVGDNGRNGDGVTLTVQPVEMLCGEQPVLWANLTIGQARLLHAALGSVLKLRKAQDAAEGI